MDEIVIVGTGRLACDCAAYCYEKYPIRVYEYGGHALSMLSRFCDKRHIHYAASGKEALREILQKIQSNTLIVSANNTFIFPGELLQRDNITGINFHPSLLPKHPGRNAEAWAIYEEDKKAGVTWHLMNEKVDAGRILKQKEVEITDKTTSIGLMERQFKVAGELFVEMIDMLMAEDYSNMDMTDNHTREEDIKLSTDVPNEGRLDIRWNTAKISAFLRAMDYGRLEFLGKPYCEYEKEYYEWSDYHIEPNREGISGNAANGVFADRDMCIKLEGWCKCTDTLNIKIATPVQPSFSSRA